MKEDPELLNALFKDKQPAEILAYFLDKYKGKVALGSSLGAEDQVLTDMIVKIDRKTKIFTLDTGRLFPETYQLIEKTNRKYQINIRIYFPDTVQVEKMVNEKGINLFYESIENRKLCCHIRKIEPSKRALHGMKIWITGIRKDQSLSRFYNKHVEWENENKLLKINPLLNWTEKQVWEYIKFNHVPYNELHDKGFPSIGCMPCTRTVKPGEDIRSGRWWWEDAGHKECGLHNRK
ncbi:MAG: phosphoadenylyl-sulfate reductase [Bacteroidales bacterium]|nr:phosphoadenylyl-sulfate reductase [Bacteroidales bacterium]